jgi:hypothetical protein
MVWPRRFVAACASISLRSQGEPRDFCGQAFGRRPSRGENTTVEPLAPHTRRSCARDRDSTLVVGSLASRSHRRERPRIQALDAGFNGIFVVEPADLAGTVGTCASTSGFMSFATSGRAAHPVAPFMLMRGARRKPGPSLTVLAYRSRTRLRTDSRTSGTGRQKTARSSAPTCTPACC